MGGWMFKTALNIEISVIEIYLYFGACNLLFNKKENNFLLILYQHFFINFVILIEIENAKYFKHNLQITTYFASSKFIKYKLVRMDAFSINNLVKLKEKSNVRFYVIKVKMPCMQRIINGSRSFG
jgi:hypothetical protein